MIRSRSFRTGLALLLLGLLGGAVYLYHHLPTIVAHQARQTLRDYGVEDFTIERPAFATRQLNIEKLWLRGSYEGYTYEATLGPLEIRFDWRMLISGQLQSVTLSSLDLTIEQTPDNSNPQPAILNVESLLPQEFIAQLPVQAVDIRRWNIDYRSASVAPLSVSGNLQISEQLQVQLESTLAGGTIAAVMRTSDATPALEIDVALSTEEADVITMSAQLQRGRTKDWEWNLQGAWHYAPLLTWLQQLATQTSLTLDNSIVAALKVTGDGEVTAQVQHANELNFPPIPERPARQVFEADIHVVTTLQQLTYTDTIDRLAGTLDMAVSLHKGQLQLTVEPFGLSGELHTGQLSLPQNTQNWLHWQETVPLVWSSPEPLIINSSDNGSWSGQLHNALVILGDTDSQLQLQAINLKTTLTAIEPFQLTTELGTDITTRIRSQQFPQFKLTFRQQGNVQGSALTLALREATGSIDFIAEATADLITGRGDYHLSVRSPDLPYFINTVVPSIQHFGWLQSDVEILSGSVQLDTSVTSNGFQEPHWAQQSQLELQDISGSFNDYRFERVALTANWTGIEQWKTVQPVVLSVENVDLGFAVNNIVTHLSLPKATAIAQPIVRIEKFSADVFGGQLLLPEPATWDFGAPSNTFKLQARQWQLADMVALQQDQDISARGTLEGELPITMTDGRVIIKKGVLAALPPGGTIRYAANDASRALGGSSNELSLAMDLLSDFQYQVLRSAVDLDSDGNLLLELSLEGHNPDQFEGRAINFNINLEQNLDPLLQSLRLSDKLVEKIENRAH